ncbi:hypothetical protein ACTXGL_03955 [Psychrobacter sp. T6-6]|uniref:hypothetical protein n=1 Tax=Psychrobacter sp. T6-6 TaxID=3457452 RepID=UPI003FCF27BF
MNRKQMRPLSTKSSRATSAKAGRRVWITLIFALLLVAVAYFIWAKPQPDPVLPISKSPTMAEQTEAAKAASNSKDMTNDEHDIIIDDSEDMNESVILDGSASTELPSPAAILNAPIPKTDSLAKEEIDRLEDERKRLAEQEKLAAEQLAMSKKLTDMKAEEIALLEQQIAQLEADGAGQTEPQ